MSLEELKLVSELCFGRYADGTEFYLNAFRIKFNYLITPNISKRICFEFLMKLLKLEYPESDPEKSFEFMIGRVLGTNKNEL